MFAASLVVLALVTAACSGGEETSGPQPSPASSATASGPAADLIDLPDPCGLLTEEEIAEATGLPFGPGEMSDQLTTEDQRVCDWVSDDPFATAQVLVGNFGEQFDSQRESAAGVYDLEDVDLADAGYRTSDGSLFALRVGDLFLQVSYIPNDPGEVTETTRSLTEQALARLSSS